MSMKPKHQVGIGTGPRIKREKSESGSSTKSGLYAEMGTGQSKQPETANDDLSANASGLLETLQNHIEDLRNLTTCKVCVKSLYEPYTLSCGHTFCYGCLSQWFANKSKKTCPDCRADVKQVPAPAYLVKELTQIFVGRPELLPPGETTDQHREWQQEEARAVEKDKANTSPITGGLFGGGFNLRRLPHPHLHHAHHHLLMRNSLLPANHFTAGVPRPIRDEEDRVDRCPRCTWELEDGECGHCGFAVGGMDDFSDMSTADTDLDGEISLDDEELMEEMEMEELEHELLYRGGHLEQAHDYTSSPGPQSMTTGSDGEDTGGMADDDESDEDAGSLNDFVEDDAQGPSSPASTTTTRPDDIDADEADSDLDSDSSSEASVSIRPFPPGLTTSQRRRRHVSDSDSDSDDDSDGDETIGEISTAAQTQNRPTSAGTSRQSPIAVEISSDDSDDAIRPPTTRQRHSVRPIRRLRAPIDVGFNDLQAPINQMHDTVRALAEVHRPSSRSPREHHDRPRTSSSNPPPRDRNRITRSASRDITRRHSPYFRTPFSRPTLSRPISSTTNTPAITTVSRGPLNQISRFNAAGSFINNVGRPNGTPTQRNLQTPFERGQSNERDDRLGNIFPPPALAPRRAPFPDQGPASSAGGQRRGSGSRSSPVTLSSPGDQK